MSKLMTGAMGVVVAVLVIGAGSSANAQGFGFSFGKHGKHKSFGVSVGFGGHCEPRPHCGTPVHVHHGGCQRFVQGHFETVCEQVWVPGACRQVWVEPVYRTEYDHCGRPVQVLVACGHFETIQDPGHYETVNRQVWHEGYWQMACGF